MKYLGIDPGKSGGIAIVDQDGKLEKLYTIPTIGKEIDIRALSEILQKHPECTVAIENVHSMHQMSANSNFQFGFVCGVLEGLVSGLGMKYVKVAPKMWQEIIFRGVPVHRKPKKEEKLKSGAIKVTTGSVDTKKMSLIAAKRLFPKESFLANEKSSVPHDGLYDAANIAEYARRMNL